MDVSSFSEIEEEFNARISRIVWCTMATVDRMGRPRSRIIHPIWEGSTGWIATGRQSFKAKHLEQNPYVSLSYWDPEHKQVYVDCKAEWIDALGEKQRIWELYKNTPPPMGYDPGLFFQNGHADPGFGVLKLSPWRIELWSLQELATSQEAKLWRA